MEDTQLKLLEEKDKERYKSFLESNERCNFQQSLEWGNVKTSWIKEVILSEDKDGNIRGSLCVWIRKIPFFGNIMYSARGPVCDIYDEEIIQDLVDGANLLAKKYNAKINEILINVFSDFEIIDNTGTKSSFDAKWVGKYIATGDGSDEVEREAAAKKCYSGGCYYSGTGIFSPLVGGCDSFEKLFVMLYDKCVTDPGLFSESDKIEWHLYVLIPKGDISKYSSFTIQHKSK